MAELLSKIDTNGLLLSYGTKFELCKKDGSFGLAITPPGQFIIYSTNQHPLPFPKDDDRNHPRRLEDEITRISITMGRYSPCPLVEVHLLGRTYVFLFPQASTQEWLTEE